MKGDCYLATASDKDLLTVGTCGGAVTSLLKYALESKRVDAVLAIKGMNGNRYDGVPTFITNPDEVINTAGSLHCSSANIARCLKEYLDGATDLKIAVTCKPCDSRGIIELTKRTQINLENLLLIGLNCTGTILPTTAKKMLENKLKIDPFDVTSEEIEDDKLIITLKDGGKKEMDLAELENKGYGRRGNCRKCEINIPTMTDIACGKWGTGNKKETFIEVCSEEGSEFIQGAIEAGSIKVEQPSEEVKKNRKKKDDAAVALAKKWQERDFTQLKSMDMNSRFEYWSNQFSQCIKCYGCRDSCPICYCKHCSLEADRDIVPGGEIAPSIMFPLIRTAHVMDSCVNCGQCEDACPMEIPLAQLIFMLNKELGEIFGYNSGMDTETLPPLRTIMDEELNISGVNLKF
ncbi:MAG: formate dehydrogenase [Bacteroidetes bacterium]|nr:MAG: formate dehydrogenase [Bacteroidota bacterium]